MQSVSSQFLARFAAPVQSPRWRLEVLASSGFNFPADVEISATASSTKNTYSGSGQVDSFFRAANLGDGQAGEPIKYAVLDQAQCRLGANFCAGGEAAKYTPGWWSEVKSDSNGVFSSTPWVELVYSRAMEANRIRVSTTTAYPGAHTVNVQVRYQGAGSYTDLGDFAFGAGSRVVAELGGKRMVERIKVAVKKTKAAESYARLTEVEPVLEYSADTSLGSIEDYCEDIRLRKSSGTVTAYAPAAPGFGVNELSLTLSKSAPLTPEENQLIRIYIGYDDELLPQGAFIVTEVREGVDTWDVTAHGILSLAAYHHYPDTVWRSLKVSTAVKRLLEWIGITEDGISSALSSDPVWEWYIVEGGPCDEALRRAAEAFGIAIYEDENTQIWVRSSYGSSVWTISDDYIEDIAQTKPREVNCVTVQYGNIREGAQDWVLSGQAELAASETKTYVFRYSKSPCLDVRPPVIESFKDANKQDLTLPTILSWAADAYSLTVTLRNNVATAGTFAIKVWGTPLEKSSSEAVYETKDEAAIRRRGLRPYEARIYTDSSSVAQAYGDRLLQYLRACSGALEVTVNRPVPHLQLRDVVRVNSSALGIDAEYVVVEIAIAENTRLSLIPKSAVI